MAPTRIDLTDDATWARAWEVDDNADKTTLLATAGAPKGLARGDFVYQIDTDVWYVFAGGSTLVQLTNIAAENIIGEWVNVPYNAGDFTGAGTITWTVAAGDVTDFSYIILNDKTVVLNLRIESTSVAGVGNTLDVALPAAITPVKSIAGPSLVFDNSTNANGFFSMTGGVASFSFIRGDTGNFAGSVNATSVYAVVTYEI